jgi:hypothetical protein
MDNEICEARVGCSPKITTWSRSVRVEGDTVSVGYDIAPTEYEGPLFFEFQRPAVVSRDDLREFSAWLAWSDAGETVH